MKQQRIQPPLRMALSLALIGLLSMTAMAGRKDAGSSRLTGQSVSGHAKRTALAGITAAAAPKRILIYGPTLDNSVAPNEKTVAEAAGHTVTVADEATWAAMTTAQFASYDAIVLGDPSCDNYGGIELLATANATKSVWSRAITGSIYVQGTDPVWHGSSDDDPVAATQVLMLDGINFVAGGPGTGLYVSLSCFYVSESETPVDVLSSIGDFQAIDSECSDAVTIVNPTHPAMAGLTSADLSDWGCSTHELITKFPSNFEVLATAVRPSDSASLPYIIASVRSVNPIDDAGNFVRQQYRDFLNREADPDGLAFWTNEIMLCGSDAQCVQDRRINVSAAYFLSIEFQETGYLVYRVYKASYGNLPNAPVPITLNEFQPDTKEIEQGVIVNQAGWETLLENNKQAFTAEFVQRSRFAATYPTSMSPEALVDALFTNAGVLPASSDRTAAINEFGSALTTADLAARARALRDVAENSTLNQQEFNRAFVLMQYFGYLRRNPNEPPEPTLDYQGYSFWLDKLNTFNGNFVQAEMVKAFLDSTEYRQRFSP